MTPGPGVLGAGGPESGSGWIAALGGWLARPLSSLGIDTFEHPEYLLLTGAVAVAVLWIGARRRRGALPWPGLSEAGVAGGRVREAVPAIARLLRAAALAALALCLAGPISLHRPPPEPGLGLDIILVVDASGSMASLDAREDGRTLTRLDLARRVVGRFARERVAEGDRVSLVVFGDAAFTQCPLTGDAALLTAALERVHVGMAGENTALGDALALAVKRAGASDGAAGRVVVLLTDGRSNAGHVPLEVASELAAASHVRVHAVAIGVGGEEVPVATREGVASTGIRFERHDLDVEPLRRLAEATGGRFHHARRASDLASVYAEIDSLERVARSLPPRERSAPHSEPLIALAGGCLLAELALARILRRRIP